VCAKFLQLKQRNHFKQTEHRCENSSIFSHVVFILKFSDIHIFTWQYFGMGGVVFLISFYEKEKYKKMEK